MIDLGKDWNELASRVEAPKMRAAREIAVEGQYTRKFALDFEETRR